MEKKFNHFFSFIYLAIINLMDNKSHTSTRDQLRQNPMQSLESDHFVGGNSSFINPSNNSSAKESTSAMNTTINSNINVEPLIPGFTQQTINTPTMRRSNIQKYYLTDDTSSDYGCKRLEQFNHHNSYAKQPCRDLLTSPTLSLNSHRFNHYPPNFIEHIYECIDEDLNIAKLLNPTGNRRLVDGQQFRGLNKSSKMSDNRPLIAGLSSPRNNHFLTNKQNSQPQNLPAIVRDNTLMKNTILTPTTTSSINQQHHDGVKR